MGNLRAFWGAVVLGIVLTTSCLDGDINYYLTGSGGPTGSGGAANGGGGAGGAKATGGGGAGGAAAGGAGGSGACGGTSCDDANPCITDACDAMTMKCVFTALADGTLTPGVNQPGDCKVHTCVGGNDTNGNDDNDVPATATHSAGRVP